MQVSSTTMSQVPYKNLAVEFDEYFSSLVRLLPQAPHNLYEPVNYFLNLDGKRIRPLLVLIASDCFNGDTKKALPAATAVELFHNFSLIHDDIMDKAPLRRGKQTVHEKWNNNIAILSGDVLLVKAYQELAKCEVDVLDIFSQTAINVCEGQQYDMDFENRADVTIAQYLEMIKLKTAVLLAASLQMGALSAGAPYKNSAVFYTAGINMGMAFQLTDDYLDVFGDIEKIGKQSGGDIIANKKTWLLLKAFELSNEKQQQELNKWLAVKTDSNEKVAAVKNIFIQLNLEKLLETEIDSYYNKTFVDLRAACPNTQKVESFISFIQTLVKRNK